MTGSGTRARPQACQHFPSLCSREKSIRPEHITFESTQGLGLDAKADRPVRDAGQEPSAPLLGTGGDDGREQLAQTAGDPAGMEDPAATIPQLVNLLETGARRGHNIVVTLAQLRTDELHEVTFVRHA